MANLGPLQQNQTYGNLLQIDGGLGTELRPVLDGNGNQSPLSLSLTSALITGLVVDDANNLLGGSPGAIPYQSGISQTDFVNPGTLGYFLRSGGVGSPTWAPITPATINAVATDGSNAMASSLSLGSNRIYNLATPILGTDAATKAYVDSVATGLKVKQACRLASTANLSLTGAATVDGIAVVTADRILVKNQTTASQNGIYSANTAGAWTRTTDADTWDEIVGATCFVTAGSTQANTTWASTTTAGGTLGTTAIAFQLFGASTAYTAGTGLTLVGSQFSLATPVSVANGGTGASVAPTARTNLGLGNIATISLPSPTNTTDFLRADGTWTAPSGGMYFNVKTYGAVGNGIADDTAALNTAITAAGFGGTIFFPPGTYTITSTIAINNVNVLGVGGASVLQGSTASLGASNPMFKLSGVCNISNIIARFDSKPASASQGQYVIFWLGNVTYTNAPGLQRPSVLNYIWTQQCGTAFYNPDTSSTVDTSCFSVTFSNLRIENFRYRGFDFKSVVRTGNVYSNIYVNTAQSGTSPNIITDTCNTLFALQGAESECTISQLNLEWANFTNAALVLDHCNNFAITSLHLEHLTPANNTSFIWTNSSSGTIDALTIYGNYYPQSAIPTPTGFSFFKINSVNNNQNGSVTNNYTANYYSIGVLNFANYSTTNNPVIFARGTDDGPVYVEIGGYQYAGSSGENAYWATFPKSGNIEFISTGVNSNYNNAYRTFSGLTTVRNDLLTTAAAGTVSEFRRPTVGAVAQFYVGSTASGQLYLPASGGTPAFYSGSDYRLKENLTPISNATDRLRNIQAYTYNLVGQSDAIEGFIAHELATVCPNAVLGEKDAIDEGGNPVYQQVAPAKLIPIMAQAIKDLIGRIEILENTNV